MKIKENSITFLNPAGEKLWAILTLPDEEGKLQALIMCHGFSQTKSQRKFVELARKLAENNIASLRFDFSGHGDSEGEFEILSIEGQVQDLKSAYDALLKNEKIDREKIAILGHSLGALVTVLFQVKYRKAKALILVSPALHQRELIKEWYNQEEIDLWKKQGYLDTPKGRLDIQYLKEAESKDWSGVASQVDAPTLIIHGEKDEDVSIKYTEDLFQKLNCQKKLEIIRDADHHFENHQAKEVLVGFSLDWLKKFL